MLGLSRQRENAGRAHEFLLLAQDMFEAQLVLVGQSPPRNYIVDQSKYVRI